MSGDCWAVGHIADVTFIDNAQLLDDVGVAGSSKQLSSVLGTAHGGNGGSQAASDALLYGYVLFFFRSTTPNVTPRVAAREDRAVYCYVVRGRAVGWDESAPRVDDGTPGELLLPGQPITLPWGAYWCVLGVIPACWDGTRSHLDSVGSNRVAAQVNGWEHAVPQGELLNATSDPLQSPVYDMTVDGLPVMRIAGDQVVWVRVNRRDNPGV